LTNLWDNLLRNISYHLLINQTRFY